MIEEGAYGIVRITRGAYKGQLGYYDDDDFARGTTKAIVYLTAPAIPDAVYTLLSLRSLEPATTEEKAQFEIEHLAALPPALRDRLGYHP